MQTYADFEQQQHAILKNLERRDLECISCPSCSSQWFEQVRISRFKADHNIVLGQDVPPKPSTIPYVLLRCICCQDFLEPRVLHNTRDVVGGDYNHFLDTLEGKHDNREDEEEKEVTTNEIQAEEL